jgi:antitoxin (DNA-binding transcriptional repressor) of toxin-antitoxin stability system
MQRRWKIAFAAAGIAVVAAGLAVLLVSRGRPVASQRAVPVRHPRRSVVQLGTGRRSMQRRWKITLAGAGAAVAAAGLSVLLVLLVSGGRPVA